MNEKGWHMEETVGTVLINTCAIADGENLTMEQLLEIFDEMEKEAIVASVIHKGVMYLSKQDVIDAGI